MNSNIVAVAESSSQTQSHAELQYSGRCMDSCSGGTPGNGARKLPHTDPHDPRGSLSLFYQGLAPPDRVENPPLQFMVQRGKLRTGARALHLPRSHGQYVVQTQQPQRACKQGFLFFSFLFFFFPRATPMAYGGSQARGLIGAVATHLCQSYSNA